MVVLQKEKVSKTCSVCFTSILYKLGTTQQFLETPPWDTLCAIVSRNLSLFVSKLIVPDLLCLLEWRNTYLAQRLKLQLELLTEISFWTEYIFLLVLNNLRLWPLLDAMSNHWVSYLSIMQLYYVNSQCVFKGCSVC